MGKSKLPEDGAAVDTSQGKGPVNLAGTPALDLLGALGHDREALLRYLRLRGRDGQPFDAVPTWSERIASAEVGKAISQTSSALHAKLLAEVQGLF